MGAHPASLAPVVLLILASTVVAQDRHPLEQACSENQRFQLQVRPGRAHGDQTRSARAALSEHRRGQSRGRKIWSTKLANDIAPVHALIRNDGRFVVTLDEFRRGGAAHALVVYDRLGKQLREFDLRELLHGDDWGHVRVAERAVEWLSGARFAFVEEPEQFVIELAWGRKIRIDLKQLEVVRDVESDDPDAAEAPPDVPPEVLALLGQPSSAPAADADTPAEPTDADVLQALQQLQALASAAGVEIDGLAEAVAAKVDAVDDASIGGGAATAVASASPATENPPQFAGNSGTTGVGVPAPDPANPVDYVAWMQEQTLTDGPSAAPFYQAAMEAAVDVEGEALRQLVGDAVRGDPAALASPEIAEWLAANQEALAQLRAGNQLEYRGMFENFENDMVISVLLPHLSKMRTLAKATVIEAQQFEAAGDLDAAMDRYFDGLATGSSSAQGATLIENLVGVAIQDLSAQSMLDTIARDAGEAIDYQQLADELESEYRTVRPAEDTFQFERVMILDLIQRGYEVNPETGNYRVSDEGLRKICEELQGVGNGALSEPALGFMLGAQGFESMVEQVNTHYDALTDAARLPYQESRAAFRETDARIEDPAFRMRNPLMAVLLPSLGRYTHLTVKAETTRRATRLITNLKAYHQRHGTYPDSLEVFGDADMVVDPFTDAHFVYHSDGNDFTLYSLAGNGLDDGGVHGRSGDTGDLLFWPRPP